MPPQSDPSITFNASAAAQRLEQDIVYYGVAFLVVSLVTFIVVFLWRLRAGNDKLDGIARMDLTKSSVGLTPEELRMIRQAQARHLEKISQQSGPKARPETLLYDPEVLKLADMAASKRQAVVPPPDEVKEQSPSTPNGIQEEELPQLPADVLKMAELGLITPEELEAIRERIRAKKLQIQQ